LVGLDLAQLYGQSHPFLGKFFEPLVLGELLLDGVEALVWDVFGVALSHINRINRYGEIGTGNIYGKQGPLPPF